MMEVIPNDKTQHLEQTHPGTSVCSSDGAIMALGCRWSLLLSRDKRNIKRSECDKMQVSLQRTSQV
jgi:hypothetical protein